MAYKTDCRCKIDNSEDFEVVGFNESVIQLKSDNEEIGIVEICVEDMKIVKPMYAMTVHKAQ
eukprot:11494486-Heterocapsa_arctica.AAC.1